MPLSFLNIPLTASVLGLVLPLVIAIALLELVLKGFALWYAARGAQKWWFIAILIINSAGILPLIYLLFFRPDAPYQDTFSRKNATNDTPKGPSSPAA